MCWRTFFAGSDWIVASGAALAAAMDWRKFAKDSGTPYRSIGAICAAEVAQAYAGDVARPKKR